MNKLLVAIFDKKCLSWSDPVAVPNLPTACRMAETLMGSPDSLYGKYPDDFEVYRIGDFTINEAGKLTLIPCDSPVLICRMAEFIKEAK